MGSGTRLALAVSVAVVVLSVLVSAVSLEHRQRTRVTVRGDDDDDSAVTQKSPVPAALPAEVKVLKDEAEFPPNQPGAPPVPAFADPPGEKPEKPLSADGGRFVSLRGDDEEDEDESEKDGPARVKTGKKKGGDGEDDDDEETDEEKELKAAKTNGTVVPRKEFPQDRPLPQRGLLKPPLSPPPSWLHTTVRIGNLLIVFGGVKAYAHSFWNDLWEYDVGAAEWRNVQASYIPPFPAANVVFQKPPENEFYRPNGIPVPPPMQIDPLANEDEDPINAPAGGAKGDPAPLGKDVSEPDPSAVGMKPLKGVPSAAELKRMQDNEARKQKLRAQKRRERSSPAARMAAKRQRMLRRKRLEARLKKQAEAKKKKELKALGDKWKKYWQTTYEQKVKAWEKDHKKALTIDLTGGPDAAPVSVSFAKQLPTPATDEEAAKEAEAEAEAGSGGGSGGSGGSEAEGEKAAEAEAEEESDGSAEDEARFALKNSARFVQVDPRTGAQREHRRRHHSGRAASNARLPQSFGDLFAASEPVTSASSSFAAPQQPHRQWMGAFGPSLLQVSEQTHAARRHHSAAGNAVMPRILRERLLSTHLARGQTPSDLRPDDAAAFFELSQRVSHQIRTGAATATATAAMVGGGDDDGEDGSGLDPDADHAVVQDQQNPKFGTPFVGDEVWTFNIDTKKWQFVKKKIRLGAAFPQPRWLHSAVVIEGRMLVFGGVNPDSVILGDVWAFNPDDGGWAEAKVEGVPILPREGHSAVAVGNAMIVFGGISYAYSPFNDVWTYQSGTNTWLMNKIAGPKPAPRWMHSAVLHAAKSGARSMFVFGGITHQYVPLNDLWQLSIASLTWSQPATKGHAPFPRMLHAALIYEDTMFVHSGAANNMMHEDLWTIDVADAFKWEEQLPSGASPFARMGHTITLVSPPINPTPYRDNRPPWTPADPNIPAPKTPKPAPLRPRKEYSTNRFVYLFGGARNTPSPTDGFIARGPHSHAMPPPNAPGLSINFPTAAIPTPGMAVPGAVPGAMPGFVGPDVPAAGMRMP